MVLPSSRQGAFLMLTARAWSLSLLLGCALALPGVADDFRPRKFDWPQWQGPQRTAISQEKGLLKSWPKQGPPLVWKATGLGEGFVTPSIAAGRVLLMGNLDPDEYVICLSEETGKELWKTVVGPVRSDGGGYHGPRCTPSVDGDHVYALGLNGDLVCLSVAEGKEH